MPDNSADYAATAKGARLANGGARGGVRRQPRAPRMPSAVGYLIATVLLTLAVFLVAWWLLDGAGDRDPWLLSTVAASFVVVFAIAAREVMMRRAWAHYTHDLKLRMGSSGEAAKVVASPRREHPQGGVQTTASSLRALQQRLAKAEEAGAQQPEAHLEAFRLCEQYLTDSEQSMRARGVATDLRVALRAGQERVRELRRHHLLAWARGEAQRLTHEAQRRASVSARIETAMRAADVIGEALRVYPEEQELLDSAVAVRNFIASVKVAHWVELAERAAFRGRFRRAIARYRDALFYLSRAEMGEDARDVAASRINREIEMLRARIATGELVEEKSPPRPRKARRGKSKGEGGTAP